MEEVKEVSFIIRLPKWINDRLKELSQRLGETKISLVRQAIIYFLNEKEEKIKELMKSSKRDT